MKMIRSLIYPINGLTGLSRKLACCGTVLNFYFPQMSQEILRREYIFVKPCGQSTKTGGCGTSEHQGFHVLQFREICGQFFDSAVHKKPCVGGPQTSGINLAMCRTGALWYGLQQPTLNRYIARLGEQARQRSGK